MHISKSNSKLGKVHSFSRLSRETCPSSCTHFGPDTNTPGDCYATKIERIYPNVKKAYTNNTVITDWNKFRALLLSAKNKNVPVRINVSGDFIKRDILGREILDLKYLNAWIKALKSIKKSQRPKVWLYTHVADKRILELCKYGVAVYASIDNDKMLTKFKQAGFTLFAFNSEDRKGKPQKKIQHNKFQIFDGQKIPVCWEQLGTKKTCADCKYCINGKGSIVFLNH